MEAGLYLIGRKGEASGLEKGKGTMRITAAGTVDYSPGMTAFPLDNSPNLSAFWTEVGKVAGRESGLRENYLSQDSTVLGICELHGRTSSSRVTGFQRRLVKFTSSQGEGSLARQTCWYSQPP